MSQDLFEAGESAKRPAPGAPLADLRERAPLAERMRPESIEEFLGQEELLAPGRPLRSLIESGRVPSMIFWGPPGCGKTTLAFLIANHTRSDFVTLSAVSAQIRDVRKILDQARVNLRHGLRTILFVDEIHRFNKAQQDAFLPAVEAGIITLIGATTENPSFSVIAPLLSRCRIFTLRALGPEALRRILAAALTDARRGIAGAALEVDEAVFDAIISLSDGDARRALNLLEIGAEAVRAQGAAQLTTELLRQIAQRHLLYDKTGEEHYNLISAFHKSLRSSDPQAALYWMARMLVSGEDPRFLARRMIRFASEDVGLADPQALVQTLAAHQAYLTLGSPEGELALVQAAVYLATAPKSNSLYAAEGAVREEIERSGSLPAPLALRNAPTGFMKAIGYGEGYTYDHDSPDHFIPKRCLPDLIASARFYQPGPFGFEKEIARRLEWWEKRRRQAEEPVSPAAGEALPPPPPSPQSSDPE